MRPSPFHWLLCLATLVVSIWGLGVLQAGGAQAAPAQGPASRSECPPSRARGLPSDGPLKISFCYHDFTESIHRFSCTLDGSFDLQEEASFGYPSDHEIIWQELDRRLTEAINKEAGDLVRYGQIRVSHDADPTKGIYWDWKLADREWEAERPTKERLPQARQKDAQRFEDWVGKELSARAQKLYLDYFRERGFDEGSAGAPGSVEIAYKVLADRARPQLSDCFDKFVREAGAEDEEERVNLLLSAFQEMNFQFPLNEENGLFKSGFWVPTEVLRIASGDCDSKSAALCALWQHPAPQIVLFVEEVPDEVKRSLPSNLRADEHAILGVEAVPGFHQASEMLGLRRYVLCEVVKRDGPGSKKLQSGEQLFRGRVVNWFCMTDDCRGDRDSPPAFD